MTSGQQNSTGKVASAQLIPSSETYHGSTTQTHTKPFVIGVCGGTASGKTSVCSKIIAGLVQNKMEHKGILSLPQDCFYRDLTPEEAANIKSFNFDHPSAYAFPEIIAAVKSLKAGNAVDIPVYDFVTSKRLPAVVHVPYADVILFDGILAFHSPELRDLFDIKIFVDADADTRLARRIRRDIVERGRDVLAVLDQYERTVKPSFESFILPTKQYADIIVPRGGDNTVAIDLLLQHIRLKLMERASSRSSSRAGDRVAEDSSAAVAGVQPAAVAVAAGGGP